MLLLSDAGASDAASGVDLTFDDQAAGPAPDPLVSGSYLPTNLIEGFDDQFPAPAPPGPYPSALSVFNETDPVGTWSLYLVDDDAEVGGSITGWRLIVNDRPRRVLTLPSTRLTALEGQRSVSVTVSRPAGGPASVGYAAVQSFANLPPPAAATSSPSPGRSASRPARPARRSRFH